MKTYIVAYTLKHSDIADTFKDYWMPFKEDEGSTIDDAKKYYQNLIQNDGDEDGWYLWTICLSQVIESTDNY